MANLFNKIFTGTLAQYTSASKEANALYMVYDGTTGVKSMYRGETKVSGDFIIVNGAAPATPEQGVIYYISAFVKDGAATGKPFVGFWDGSKWVALSDSATIDSLDSRITTLENTVNGTGEGESHVAGLVDKVATLMGADTVDGSVAHAVKVAKEALEGTLSETDAKTLEALNDRIDTLDAKATVVAGDKVLTQTAAGIASGLSLDYSKNDKKIYLYGSAKDDTHKISEISTADFVVDGMLEDAKLITESDKHADEPEVPYIRMTFNTDAGNKVVEFSVKDLVDVYTSTSDEVEVNDDRSISLADAVKTAINGELSEVVKSDSKTDAKGFVTLDVTVKTDTKAEGAKYSVNKQEVGVQVTYGTFKNGETAAVDGVANVAAVQDEIDAVKALITGKNVTAEGDDYVSATAAEGTNKVVVAATDSTKASLALADSALQTVTGETGDDALISVSTKVDNASSVSATTKLTAAVAAAESAIQSVVEVEKGQEVSVSTAGTKVTIGVSKAAYTEANDEKKTNGVLTEAGLVDGTVLKNYVADQIAQNAVYWETL